MHNVLKTFGNMITKKEDYNNVPIHYCSKCLDLKISVLTSGKGITKDIDYCMRCGAVEIDETHIFDWENKYKEMYGKSHITPNK